MISRRIFLKDGAFALVSIGYAPSFLARTAFAQGQSVRTRRLVAIFLRGAVDGLSVVVPVGDSDYYRARPGLAVARPGTGSDAAIDLDGFFGLNPRLRALKPFWDTKQLAIVHACGSPDATRSHFDAQDYMETATPGVKSTGDGWLNRYLQAQHVTAASPFRAVALTGQVPRALQGRSPTLAFDQVGRFNIQADPSTTTGDSFEAIYAAAADQVLGAAGRGAFNAMRTLKTANLDQYVAANGAQYPGSPFGQALKQIAQLIKANVGVEVAFAEAGGWDTHVNQGPVQGRLAARLADLSQGLAALMTDLGDRMEDTVVLTMSEFGRAVAENGNRGTDHGHGNAMLVMGGGVRGGRVYGTWPGLLTDQRFEGRDPAVTTDFRDVFGEIVVRHMGIPDARPVFPGYTVLPTRFVGLFA